jgi:5-methylcytosine-specific restriction endonuclease McrA
MPRDRRERFRAGALQGAIMLDFGCLVVECKYCKVWLPENLWTTDHVVPSSRGGRYRVLSNLAIACHRCNQIKGSRIVCTCGSFRVQRTYDRISWTLTEYCVGCNKVTWCQSRPRPGEAPPHLRYGRHYRATGEIAAMRGRI